MKESDSHGYCKLFLSSEAAKLAPEGLLEGHNNVPGWKAIIRQLEDQLAAGPLAEQAAADQAEGLLGFADRMLKTPSAPTPMRPSRRRQHNSLEDGEDAEAGGGRGNNHNDFMTTLQRLEDSVGHMRGELGLWRKDARYLTLHEGMMSLGEEHASLHQGVAGLAHNLQTTDQQADSSRAEVNQVLASLRGEVTRLTQSRGNVLGWDALRREVKGLKTERADLESAVLTLSNAVTGLLDAAVARGPSSGLDQAYLESRFKAYDAAVTGCLDYIRQEMKGGGITV